MKALVIRSLEPRDQELMWHFLTLAAHDDMAFIKAFSPVAVYARNFGREGDFGFVATDGEQIVGLVWARCWPDEKGESGFGFIAPDIPEIALAVEPAFQGQGIGRLLLKEIIQFSRDKYPALSLNVRLDNPALRMYEKHGFERVEGSEVINRTGGTSINMILRFE